MTKRWLAVLTEDMYGKREQIIKEVELEETDELQYVKTHFPNFLD